MPYAWSIFGSYICAISFGSMSAAIVLGSIMDNILGSTPGNILGSSPANVVFVLAFEFVLVEDDDGFDWLLELLDLLDFPSIRAFTMLGSNPRLFRAFSSRPISILGSRPSSLGSRPLEEAGIDMVVDVALVGVVRDLLDDDELPDMPNILGSSPRALGSIPPRRSLGSSVANIFGSDPSSLGSIPANILGSMPILFRMASFIDEAEEAAGLEEDEDEDLLSRPNILGSIPMDFR